MAGNTQGQEVRILKQDERYVTQNKTGSENLIYEAGRDMTQNAPNFTENYIFSCIKFHTLHLY